MSNATKIRGRPPLIRDAERRKKIQDAILSDLPIKAVAVQCEVCQKVAYAAAKKLGFKRMYVTGDESAELMRGRRSKQEAAR